MAAKFQVINHIPEKVKDAMLAGGSMVTCMPVKLDDSNEWEAVIFFRVFGDESERDVVALKSGKPQSIGLETDIIEHENATVVVMRIEVETIPGSPLAGEILLTSGGADAHFEALKLLATQSRLCWFFVDEEFCTIHSQQHPLGEAQNHEFQKLLNDVTTRDAMIRMTGKYDAQAAFSSVVDHYDFRTSKLTSR